MGRWVSAFALSFAVLLTPSWSGFAQGVVALVPLGSVQHPSLGYILTDTQGLTLYTWAADTPSWGTSNCYDACADSWPPMLAGDLTESGMVLIPPVGFGAIVRDDDGVQLTYGGRPLHRFMRDTEPGQASGEGSMMNVARWSVVTLDPESGGGLFCQRGLGCSRAAPSE
jgi:predicted lipoprotein with Yx(FWY)xxD motif